MKIMGIAKDSADAISVQKWKEPGQVGVPATAHDSFRKRQEILVRDVMK